MSESVLHQQLVKLLKKEVMSIVPSDCWNLIQEDTPESRNRPPIIVEKHRPDIFYNWGSLLVIGEAKTGNDVSKKRSRSQYDSYLRMCSNFSGNAYLILSVPWLEEAEANNILRLNKKKYSGDYTTKVCAWIVGAV
jgi:hypothetical protein